jgi:hypothetical protein
MDGTPLTRVKGSNFKLFKYIKGQVLFKREIIIKMQKFGKVIENVFP